MMKLLLLTLLAVAWPVLAQTQAATSGAPLTGKVCDVTYAMEGETADHFDLGSAVLSVKAIPWVDVEDNHKKQMRVLDALSKEQDKGGEYEITVTETNTCEDGVTVRVANGSAYVTGVTLAGAVRVGDVMLQVGKEINDRYRNRAAKGAKVGWDHSKAKKVKRDDLGRKVKDRD